jgi:hypothetical protein
LAAALRAHPAGQVVEELALEAVGGADLEDLDPVQHVELGER